MLTGDLYTADLADLARVLSAVTVRLAELAGATKPAQPARPLPAVPEAQEEPSFGGMTAAEFKAARLAVGLTQVDAARLLDTSHRSVTRWESGASKISSYRAAIIRTRFSPEWVARVRATSQAAA